jgi:hypothetical protein
MSRLRRIGRIVLAVAAAGCGRGDPPPHERPSQPTLTLEPLAGAPTTGRRIVAAGQITQPSHVGSFAPASITVPAVEAGDAIVVLGVYWGDLPRGASTAPTDDRGALVRAVDQGPSVVGRTKPPVFAQLYLELDAAPGPHTITPPWLGGPAGDGTMYLLQIRGLTEHRQVAIGSTWGKGAAIPEVFVSMLGVADAGDLVLALGGYDNTAPRDDAGWSQPAGWQPLGIMSDAANNVPSQLAYRIAPALDAQALTWQWTDPTVNVVCGIVAALR